MQLGTMIGAVAVGWIAGLGFGIFRPRLARIGLLAIVLSIAAILAALLILEPQGQSWMALVFFALTGAAAGVAGPSLFGDDWLFAVGVSVVGAPFVAGFLVYLAFSLACSVGGDCM